MHFQFIEIQLPFHFNTNLRLLSWSLFFQAPVRISFTLGDKNRVPKKQVNTRLVGNDNKHWGFFGGKFSIWKSFVCTLKVGHTHTIVLFRFDFFVVSFYFSGYHHHSILMFRLVHSFRVWIPLSSSHNPCRPFCYHWPEGVHGNGSSSTFWSKLCVWLANEPLSHDHSISSNVFFYSKTHPSSNSDCNTLVPFSVAKSYP